MIRKITLLFLAFLTTVTAVNAQLCATDEVHQEMMAKDPAYAALHNAAKSLWVNYQTNMASAPVGLKQTLTNGDTVYEIPVVVHIMHTGGAVGSTYNPSDADIISTINYVNQSYEATWSGYPQAGSGGTRIPLRFALAQRDPSCAATNGINRVNAANLPSLGSTYNSDGVMRASSGVTDAALKAAVNWPRTEYYNIWVVNKIDGVDGTPGSGSFVAGYAYLPPAPAALDGTVMLATQFKPGRKTLVHELGHAMGLYHTFNGSSGPGSCPPSSNPYNCVTDDDLVCDTDPNQNLGPGSCPSGSVTNPCTGLGYGTEVQNFMNYSNCTDRFTPGQMERMMFKFVTERGYFISSLGATAPGQSPVAAACTPPNTNTTATNAGVGRVYISKTTGSSTEVFMDMKSQGYAGDGSLAYIDNTCKHVATLTSGVTYDMEVARAGAQQLQVRVYIDYNGDGDFLDAGETVFSGTTGFGLSAMFTVTPPFNVANCAPLRMRVRTETMGSSLDACNTHAVGQTEDYTVVIQGAGGSTPPVTTGIVTLTDPPIGGNPSCFGTNLTFEANPGAQIAPIYFKWFRKRGTTITNGPAGVDDSTWSGTTVFGHLDTIFVKMAYPGLCGVDTAISDSVVVLRAVTIPPQVAIGITQGSNPGCPDDITRFEVISNVNPGGNPTYTWFVNGVQSGSPSSTPYIDLTGLPDNTPVHVVMASSAGAPCAIPSSVQSSPIVFEHKFTTPTAQAALTSGTNPGCSGQTLTFTAVTTYEGNNPIYQWKVNGTNAGSNSPNFSGVFNNGDIISFDLTSNSNCVLPADRQVSSNAVTIQHIQLTADVQIAIVGGTNIACSGHPVVFSANTANSGANPDFEWMINGMPVANSNSPVFSTSTLKHNDQVSCVLKATDPCIVNPLDTSNVITMSILPSLVPSVSIALTDGKNPWCLDSTVTFTATPTNAGTNPNFEYLVNRFPTFTGQIFPNDEFLHLDTVICRLNTTDGGCYLPDTVYSNPITMYRYTRPDPPIIHLVGNMLTTNHSGAYRWWGPAGLYPPTQDGNHHPTEPGLYMAVTDNNGCWSIPSNYLIINLLDINNVEVTPIKVYPNPTNGEVVLDWGVTKMDMTITVFNSLGQLVITSEVTNKSKEIIDLSSFASGVYNIVMTDENGHTGNVKITLTR